MDKLWTGGYFRFCERSKSRDTVMADQLCGIWFLQSVSPEMAQEVGYLSLFHHFDLMTVLDSCIFLWFSESNNGYL